MTLAEYKKKQEQLLDNIPADESRNIIICTDCATFVYLKPIENNGTCKGCGSYYEEKITRKTF